MNSWKYPPESDGPTESLGGQKAWQVIATIVGLIISVIGFVAFEAWYQSIRRELRHQKNTKQVEKLKPTQATGDDP